MSTIQPMNLLVIMSDEHSKRMLGCYGNPYVKTPNLDRLAAEGVCFDNAYCNSPICVPARAAFATGRYASECGYWDNAHAFGGEYPSWGTRLREQGYKATTIGKLHYLNSDSKLGFDQRIPLNIKNGIGDIYGSIRDREITRLQFRDALLQAGPGDSDYIRYDQTIAERTAKYLRSEGVGQEKPFALHVSFVTPHFPLTVPQEFLDLYPDKNSVREPIQFHEKDWPHHPVVDDYRRYSGTAEATEEQAWFAIRAYYGLCSFMDHQVGVVLEALRETGLDRTTRIIYTSDHGDTMGDHGVYFKSTMYEGSVAVPFIVSGPDLPRNTRARTIVSLIDVFPSVIECVGADPDPADADLPGASVWQYAKGEEDDSRHAFSEYYAQGVYTAMFMFRRGKYKYVHYVGERPQLFDLDSDPEELRDLATVPEYAAVLADMEAGMREVADVDLLERQSKQAQGELLSRHGGREEFLRNFKPALFSPIPDLAE